MATQIHMDLEAARAAQSAMSSARETLNSAFEDLKKATDGIRNQGRWIGPDQLYFVDLWLQGESVKEEALEALADLTIRLGKEIEEWEKAAGKLG